MTPIAQQIVDQATRLFAARGFDGVSLQDIAGLVKLSKPSLLYHFPSKDELRRAVLDQVLGRWEQVLPRLLKAATSGQEQLDTIVRETIGFFAADPDRARLLLREALDRPRELRALIAAQIQPWIDLLVAQIRKGQARGHVRADVDPEAYVISVINLILSNLATAEVLRTGGDTIERQAKEMLRMADSSLFVRKK